MFWKLKFSKLSRPWAVKHIQIIYCVLHWCSGLILYMQIAIYCWSSIGKIISSRWNRPLTSILTILKKEVQVSTWRLSGKRRTYINHKGRLHDLIDPVMAAARIKDQLARLLRVSFIYWAHKSYTLTPCCSGLPLPYFSSVRSLSCGYMCPKEEILQLSWNH